MLQIFLLCDYFFSTWKHSPEKWFLSFLWIAYRFRRFRITKLQMRSAFIHKWTPAGKINWFYLTLLRINAWFFNCRRQWIFEGSLLNSRRNMTELVNIFTSVAYIKHFALKIFFISRDNVSIFFSEILLLFIGDRYSIYN